MSTLACLGTSAPGLAGKGELAKTCAGLSATLKVVEPTASPRDGAASARR